MVKSKDDLVLALSKIKPNIVVLGEYVSNKKKIEVMCSLDKHVWFTTPNVLLRDSRKGNGCPICNTNRKKLNLETFEKKLSEKQIKMIGTYVNARTKILLQCDKDGFVWKANPSDVYNKSGCPKCAGNDVKTKDWFLAELQKRNTEVELVGEFVSSSAKTLFRNKSSGEEWLCRPHDVLNGVSKSRRNNSFGGDSVLKTHEYFIDELKELRNDITVRSIYEGALKPIEVECTRCGLLWKTTPNSILVGKGCPDCNGSYNITLPGYLYILETTEFIGFGITNNLNRRLAKHRSTFKKEKVSAINLSIFTGDGLTIKNLEKDIKTKIKIYNSGVDGFKTESVEHEYKYELFTLIYSKEVTKIV